MNILSLSLKNFRNYQTKTFEFDQKLTIIKGPNTSGKTNLLEAIYFLSTAKSFRAQSDKDCINWQSQIGRIKAKLDNNSELEVVLTAGEVSGIKTPFKKYLVNKVAKRQIDFIGNLKSVLFRPEDLELITDSPHTRRSYLNNVLVQSDKEYRRCLLAYEKGLRQRNRLLDLIRDNKASSSQLYFWDKLLIKNGNIITNKRQEYLDFLNRKIDIFADLELEYDSSTISVERLEKYKKEEVLAGATLVGPHRDDIKIFQKKDKQLRNVHDYGSRGEQRLAVLSLKLCELDFLEEKTGARPILLLDDIFSELDQEHRDLVFKSIYNQQTIITATDFDLSANFSSSLGKTAIITLGKNSVDDKLPF